MKKIYHLSSCFFRILLITILVGTFQSVLFAMTLSEVVKKAPEDKKLLIRDLTERFEAVTEQNTQLSQLFNQYKNQIPEKFQLPLFSTEVFNSILFQLQLIPEEKIIQKQPNSQKKPLHLQTVTALLTNLKLKLIEFLQQVRSLTTK